MAIDHRGLPLITYHEIAELLGARPELAATLGLIGLTTQRCGRFFEVDQHLRGIGQLQGYLVGAGTQRRQILRSSHQPAACNAVAHAAVDGAAVVD